MTKITLPIAGFVTVVLTGCSEFVNKPDLSSPSCQQVETELPSDGSLPTESDVLAAVMSNLPIAVDWLKEDVVWLGTETSPVTIEIERTEDPVYAIQFVQETEDIHAGLCELDGEYRLMVPIEMSVMVGSIDAGYRTTLRRELEVQSLDISEILLTSTYDSTTDMSSLEFLGDWDGLFREEVMGSPSFKEVDEDAVTYGANVYSSELIEPWPNVRLTVSAEIPTASSSFLIGYWRLPE